MTRSGRLVAVGTGVLVAAVMAAAVPAVASAAPVGVQLNYTCPFPLVGNQIVAVTHTADLPAAVDPGPFVVPGLVSRITLPAAATRGFALVGAATIDGAATREVTFTGADRPVAVSPVAVPSTPIPASGAFTAVTDAVDTGAVPVTGPGPVTVRLEDLTLELTPRRTDGSETGFGTFTSACTVLPDQDQRLGTVTVTPPNTPPVTADDAYSTPAGTPLAVPAPGVLGNDTDAEGTPLTATAADTTGTAGQVALGPDGSFTYTPPAGFSGTDRFTYAASDGVATSAPAAVVITVTAPPPNRADLSATLTVPASAGRGTTFPVTLTVRNAGPGPATTVGAAVTVPLGLRITGAGGGTVIGDGTAVRFVAPALASGARVTWTVQVTAGAGPGRRPVAAVVASAVPDPRLLDNVAVAAVTVR